MRYGDLTKILKEDEYIGPEVLDRKVIDTSSAFTVTVVNLEDTKHPNGNYYLVGANHPDDDYEEFDGNGHDFSSEEEAIKVARLFISELKKYEEDGSITQTSDENNTYQVYQKAFNDVLSKNRYIEDREDLKENFGDTEDYSDKIENFNVDGYVIKESGITTTEDLSKEQAQDLVDNGSPHRVIFDKGDVVEVNANGTIYSITKTTDKKISESSENLKENFGDTEDYSDRIERLFNRWWKENADLGMRLFKGRPIVKAKYTNDEFKKPLQYLLVMNAFFVDVEPYVDEIGTYISGKIPSIEYRGHKENKDKIAWRFTQNQDAPDFFKDGEDNFKPNEGLKENDSHDKHMVLSSVMSRYPDISEEDEDYLHSLSFESLITELKNRGWFIEDLLESEVKDLAQQYKDAVGDLEGTELTINQLEELYDYNIQQEEHYNDLWEQGDNEWDTESGDLAEYYARQASLCSKQIQKIKDKLTETDLVGGVDLSLDEGSGGLSGEILDFLKDHDPYELSDVYGNDEDALIDIQDDASSGYVGIKTYLRDIIDEDRDVGSVSKAKSLLAKINNLKESEPLKESYDMYNVVESVQSSLEQLIKDISDDKVVNGNDILKIIKSILADLKDNVNEAW